MYGTFSGHFELGRIPGLIANITTVPNNVVWYDASLGTTANFNTTLTSGDDISQWKDKSGTGHNANQSGNAAAKPNWYSNAVQTGYGALRFNGTSESLNINPVTFMQSQQQFTMFVVAKASSLTGNRALVGTNTSGYRIYFNGTNYQVATASGVGTSSLAGDTTNFHIYTLIFNGNASGNDNKLKFRYDEQDVRLNFGATTVGNTTSASSTYFYIGVDDTGSAGYWQGDIGSIIVYTRALNSNEIIGVEEYLSNFWGI